MKRLEKWLREIKEKVDSEARLAPSGIIQMSPAMLHYVKNEVDQPFNLLLAPADSFIKVKNPILPLIYRPNKIYI